MKKMTCKVSYCGSVHASFANLVPENYKVTFNCSSRLMEGLFSQLFDKHFKKKKIRKKVFHKQILT